MYESIVCVDSCEHIYKLPHWQALLGLITPSLHIFEDFHPCGYKHYGLNVLANIF